MNAREQARVAARTSRPFKAGFYDVASTPLISLAQTDKIADAVSDVWEPIVRALLSPEQDSECELDHHGLCQAHYLQSPCAVALAKEALGA